MVIKNEIEFISFQRKGLQLLSESDPYALISLKNSIISKIIIL